MPHPLSTLGIVHTALSVVPVLAGLYCFARYKGIEPATRAGRLYLVSLVLSVVTSFGLSSTGGLNPGHLIGVLSLMAAFSPPVIARLAFLGRSIPYLQAFGLSFSFFLLMVPGINETLTRLPVDGPLASSIEDPVVAGTLLAWLLVFAVGFAWQCAAMRRTASRQG